MLTVTLMLSGPHRLAMLDTAFSSIPIESAVISEVVVRHQGGPWNWGGELRERILAHPKVRLVEFPDRVDWKQSFNRTLDQVRSPWALMLPDDDFLVRPVAKQSFEYVSQQKDLADIGLIAFGWHYLKDGRYVGNRFPQPGLPSILTCTPKFSTTWLNMRRVRELGGFGDMGGFVDAELFGRLACNFDAAIAPARVGIYRMHEGQESHRIAAVYGPFVDAMKQSLGPFARTPAERAAFERALADFIAPPRRPLLDNLRELAFDLRSRAQPSTREPITRIRKWSDG
jgi:hypothetical protein